MTRWATSLGCAGLAAGLCLAGLGCVGDGGGAGETAATAGATAGSAGGTGGATAGTASGGEGCVPPDQGAGSPAPGACVPDGVDPADDDPAGATLLLDDAVHTRALCAGDVDLYSLELAADAYVGVDLVVPVDRRGRPHVGTLQLLLEDAAGTTLRVSTGRHALHAVHRLLPTGTYWVRVVADPTAPDDEEAAYTLRAMILPAG